VKIRLVLMLVVMSLAAGPAIGQATGTVETSDEQMKLLALNGLRDAEPVVAVSQIEKVMAGNSSLEVKRKALGILSDIDTAQSRELLGRVARGQSVPSLQQEAIRRLGTCGDAASLKILAEIYDTASDVAVKRQILNAFRLADDTPHLLAAAKNEKSTDLRGEAIHQLGLVGASEALAQLYQAETSAGLKSQMIRAFGQADSYNELERLARSEPSPELRRAAIHQLGALDSGRAGASLVTLYQSEKETQVRKEILHSLFTQDNVKAIVGIARKETDPDLRRYAVEQLSHMDSKEATDYLLEILNK
jgi:HEAT repeat protein